MMTNTTSSSPNSISNPLEQFMLANQFSSRDLRIVEDNATAPALECCMSSVSTATTACSNNSTFDKRHRSRTKNTTSSCQRQRRISRRDRINQSCHRSSDDSGTNTTNADLIMRRWDSYPTPTTSSSSSRYEDQPEATTEHRGSSSSSSAAAPASPPFRRAATYPATPLKTSSVLTPPHKPKRRPSITTASDLVDATTRHDSRASTSDLDLPTTAHDRNSAPEIPPAA